MRPEGISGTQSKNVSAKPVYKSGTNELLKGFYQPIIQGDEYRKFNKVSGPAQISNPPVNGDEVYIIADDKKEECLRRTIEVNRGANKAVQFPTIVPIPEGYGYIDLTLDNAGAICFYTEERTGERLDLEKILVVVQDNGLVVLYPEDCFKEIPPRTNDIEQFFPKGN